MLPIQNIGLAGRAGSGKSLLAAELVKRGYVAISFARPVKVGAARAVYGPVDEETALRFVATQKEVFRPLLQAYGDAVRNLIHDAYWIDYALNNAVQDANDYGVPVVIDDVRYLNEVAALKLRGFKVYRVHRPFWHRWRHKAPRLSRSRRRHVSERVERLPVDRVLYNTNTPEGLYTALERALRG